jgi:hypothetical protein
MLNSKMDDDSLEKRRNCRECHHAPQNILLDMARCLADNHECCTNIFFTMLYTFLRSQQRFHLKIPNLKIIKIKIKKKKKKRYNWKEANSPTKN